MATQMLRNGRLCFVVWLISPLCLISWFDLFVFAIYFTKPSLNRVFYRHVTGNAFGVRLILLSGTSCSHERFFFLT